MAQYFVKVGGDDNRAGTSWDTAFQTVAKAKNTASINGGDEIIVRRGEYFEDEGGFLSLNRAFLSNTVIRSEENDKNSVRICGGSSATLNIFTGAACNNLEFKYLTLGSRIPTCNSTVRITVTAGGLKFTSCKIEVPSNNASQRNGIDISPSGATTATGVTVDDCDIDVGANTLGCAYQAAASIAGSTVTNLTLTRSRLYGRLATVQFLGGGNAMTGIDVNTNQMYGLGGYCLKIGPDSHVSAGVITGNFKKNLIDLSQGTGHGLLCAAGATDCVFENNNIFGGDYGTVLKSALRPVMRYNFIRGASVGNPINASALYLKGNVTDATIDTNTLMSDRGTSTVGTLRLGAGDDASVVTNANIQRCTIITDSKELIAWATGADANNCVSDNHIYYIRGGGNFGDVRAATNIASITALRAAWVGYGVPTNDANSVVGAQSSSGHSSHGAWSW